MRCIFYDENGRASDSKDRFLLIDMKNLCYASAQLSPSAFKLYLYLCSNKKGYSAILDGARFQKEWGVSRTQYNAAFAQLVEKKFLVLNEEENIYHFNGIKPKEDKKEKE